MARTIALSDEVYKLLKKSKLPGESFSSVIKRSLQKGRLSDIAGSNTISRADWESAKEHLFAAETMTAREMTENS